MESCNPEHPPLPSSTQNPPLLLKQPSWLLKNTQKILRGHLLGEEGMAGPMCLEAAVFLGDARDCWWHGAQDLWLSIWRAWAHSLISLLSFLLVAREPLSAHRPPPGLMEAAIHGTEISRQASGAETQEKTNLVGNHFRLNHELEWNSRWARRNCLIMATPGSESHGKVKAVVFLSHLLLSDCFISGAEWPLLFYRLHSGRRRELRLPWAFPK